MGLDLYTGTLTRYCCGKWQTTAQSTALALGIPFEVAYAAGSAPRLAAEASALAVDEFRAALSRRWGARFTCFERPPRWNEQGDTPYLTDKPDHDGVRSLVLVAGYLERPELTRPVLLPAADEGDPAYDEAGPRGYYLGNMAALECHLFLPGQANYVIVAEDPLGVERFTTSVGVLRSALDDVNVRAWQADPETVAFWYTRGLIRFGPTQTILRVDARTGRQELTEERTEVYDQVEHNAQYALACFYRACDFAEAHEVPIVVDQ